MMSSRRVVAAALATGALAWGSAASAAPLAPGEYTIGFVTENTGPLAAAGVSYHRGAQLAVEEISAGGYMGPGTKLKLSEKEAGSDPARSVQALNQFIADRNVIAISCCILSPVAGAMRPVASNAKMSMVIFGATRPDLADPPYIYSVVGLPGPQEVKMSQRLAETLKPKTVAYFVNADNEGFQGRFKAAQAVMEKAGVKTAGVVSVLSADTDFTAGATQAMATNPDLVMVWTTQTPAAGIIAALRQRGYKGPISASDVLAPAPMFKKMGAVISGVPFPVVFAPELATSAEGKRFVDAYQKKFNEAPDVYSAQGFTYLIAQGLKATDGKPTREGLGEQLNKISALEYNIYGGLPIVKGQADVANSLVANWTVDGKIAAWSPPTQ